MFNLFSFVYNKINFKNYMNFLYIYLAMHQVDDANKYDMLNVNDI